MFVWRNAVILGIGFVVVGALYLLLQGGSFEWLDQAGVTLLIVLGAAMAYTFTILLAGSREL
jgi:hypothetical protein